MRRLVIWKCWNIFFADRLYKFINCLFETYLFYSVSMCVFLDQYWWSDYGYVSINFHFSDTNIYCSRQFMSRHENDFKLIAHDFWSNNWGAKCTWYQNCRQCGRQCHFRGKFIRFINYNKLKKIKRPKSNCCQCFEFICIITRAVHLPKVSIAHLVTKGSTQLGVQNPLHVLRSQVLWVFDVFFRIIVSKNM